jgi:putative heme-binding domain-containing protein
MSLKPLLLLALALALPGKAATPPPSASPAEALASLSGFKVELIRSAAPGEGSWIALAVDPKGRLLISPQEGISNLLRITLTSEGHVAKLERVALPVGSAMGLLCAFDSLYVSGLGPDGLWIYRLRDRDGDDAYDEVQKVRRFEGAGGEHGSHALVPGPDGKIYQVHGNFVRLPSDLTSTSPLRNYAEDLVLPRAEDGNGFGIGLKPPAGFVTRMEPDGSHTELFAGGFRNIYDIAFSPEGELFGFDSDMEWDWGTPWYRPIRINHIVSGGDYGFREGTGKWPDHYPDALPSNLDVGIGSPTGMKFGTRAAFPDKYRRALYALDWTYGRLLAVHLTPDGATYRGTFENFIAPRSLTEPVPKAPLPLTDVEFGQDGAMYFITGGRATQSGLYRVSYAGPRETPTNPSTSSEGEIAREARAQRRALEFIPAGGDASTLRGIWAHLSSRDRWIRYAARLALERQPASLWQERALSETDPQALITALLALTRSGDRSLQARVIEALGGLPIDTLDEHLQQEALRVLQLAFARWGTPDTTVAQGVVQTLNPRFPAGTDRTDRELAQVLIRLNAPGIVERCMAKVAAASTLEEQLFYIFHLRNQKEGWTPDLRRDYFAWFRKPRSQEAHPALLLQWFRDAGRTYEDGASLPRFLVNTRRNAIATLTETERSSLAELIADAPKPIAAATTLKDRTFVKDWRMDDLTPRLDAISKGRSFVNGRTSFADAQCALCHRFAGDGGAVGPELSAVASKYSRREILESILDPSKVVSEQFQNVMFYLKDGDEEIGRIVEETDERVVIVTDPLRPEKPMVLSKSNINTREGSRISPMPEGLVSILSAEDILDLLAYLESGGNPAHALYAPHPQP